MSGRALPPTSTVAPFARASSTCRVTVSSWAFEISEPMSTSQPVPADSRIFFTRSTNAVTNASYTWSAT